MGGKKVLKGEFEEEEKWAKAGGGTKIIPSVLWTAVYALYQCTWGFTPMDECTWILERQLRAGAVLVGSSPLGCAWALPYLMAATEISSPASGGRAAGIWPTIHFTFFFLLTWDIAPKIQPVLTANRNHVSSNYMLTSSVIVQLTGRLRL